MENRGPERPEDLERCSRGEAGAGRGAPGGHGVAFGPGDSSVPEVFSLVLSLAPGGFSRPEGAQLRRPRWGQTSYSALVVGVGATQALEGMCVVF